MPNWLFLDMDNYFASVEQQHRPELRGRPVGVVPVQAAGTCCIAVSRQAKRLGIKTGTTVLEAKRICPEIALVEARPRFYVEVHRRICAAIERVLPIEKIESIDEVAIRLMGRERRAEAALNLGRRVKASVRDAVGEYLSCSVGLAPTRLLAKIACELDKPDGLRLLELGGLPGAIEHLAVTDLPGINTGVRARLHRHGVCTTADLWAMPREAAYRVWGSVEGTRYWMALHGEDPPRHENPRRSFGHANVLPPELRCPEGAHAVMTRLLHKAAARLRHHGYHARHLAVMSKFNHAPAWGDQIDLPTCHDTRTVVEHFERLWRRGPMADLPQLVPVRVGVTLGRLLPDAAVAGRLFGDPEHREDLGRVMDRVNQRFGKHVLYLGGMHAVAGRDMPDKIAFGRVPDEGVVM
ncbi:MAG: DNA polymerase [Planctomycetota bacterium]